MTASPRSITLVAISLLAAASCKGGNGDIALSKTASAEEADEGIPNVPMPPEDGPRLTARISDVPVLDRPAKNGTQIGALRFGGSVARAEKAYKTTADCEGGYYPVRPRGFVCASPDVALDATGAIAVDTSRALPFRHASVRSATPLYGRLPTLAEQQESEPDLQKHLTRVAKEKDRSLRAGSNDVPIDEHGVATGPAVIARSGDGVDEDGRRTVASYLKLAAAPVASTGSAPLVAAVLRRGSGVALIGGAVTEGPAGPRPFGVTPDGRYVAIDRLEPALGSTWHGVDLTKDKTLPLAFVLRHEVCPYELTRGKAKRLDDEEVERRHAVHLSGKFRTVEMVRYEEAVDGRWYRAQDVIKIVKRSKLPDFVQADTKWVDVSLALQTMTLYQGKTPLYATLISSGQDVVGDPLTTASTAQGTFKIEKKALTAALDPREVGQTHDVYDAPWALEFSPGFSIVGSYWSEPAGEARGYHNVTLTPIDAKRLFTWAGPEVPVGWRWIAPLESEQIVIHVRK